jgi:hypothetical protein
MYTKQIETLKQIIDIEPSINNKERLRYSIKLTFDL